MRQERVLWIDYAKAVAIFSVVLLHVGMPDPFKGIVRVFLIPLFFFLSGIFSNPEKYHNFCEFSKQKILRILIPYIFFNLVTYIFWLLIGRNYGLDSEFNTSLVEPLKGIVLGMYKLMTHYVPLWFIACLISVEILHYIVFKHIKTIKSTIFALLIFIIIGYLNYTFNKQSLPWGIDIAFSMIVFYVAGGKAKKILLTQQNNNLKLVVIAVLSFTVVYLMYKTNSEVKVFTNYFGNYFLFYIGAFSGIIFSVALFKLIENISKPIGFLLYIGKNTLIILALHLIASSLLKAILIYVIGLDYTQYEGTTLYSLIFSSICIIILAPAIYILNRHLPFAIGKIKTSPAISK